MVIINYFINSGFYFYVRKVCIADIELLLNTLTI